MTIGPPESTPQILFLSSQSENQRNVARYIDEKYDEVTVNHDRLGNHLNLDTTTNEIDCIVAEIPSTDTNKPIQLPDLTNSETPVILFVDQTHLTTGLSNIPDTKTTIVPRTDTQSIQHLERSIHHILDTPQPTTQNAQDLLETIVDAIITLNQEDRIISHSVPNEPIFDTDPDTLTNEILWEALPALQYSPVHTAVTKARATNKTQQVEAPFAPNQTWYRYHLYPSQDTVTILIEDITDRKHHEQSLKSVKNQLQTAIEAGAIGTWLWKIPENKLIAGPQLAKTFGVDPEDAKNGLPLEVFTESIHPDDYDRVSRSITEAVENCDDYEAEYRVFDAKDELRWVVARGHVECDDDGNPQTFPGILTDITAQKEYEQRLEEQNERLEEFASVVSHDLRNPLQVAKGNLDLIHDDIPTDHYEPITSSLQRMDDLITDLLAIARADNTTINTEPIELHPLILQCWETLDQSTATLTGSIDLVIEADEVRLQQLFENLFRNAIEHTENDVTITVGELDDGFFIEDDGPGIPEDNRDTVVEIGYSTDPHGTGFGLKIVEQAIQDHGWTLTITDSNSGGARFEITDVTIVN